MYLSIPLKRSNKGGKIVNKTRLKVQKTKISEKNTLLCTVVTCEEKFVTKESKVKCEENEWIFWEAFTKNCFKNKWLFILCNCYVTWYKSPRTFREKTSFVNLRIDEKKMTKEKSQKRNPKLITKRTNVPLDSYFYFL